jgi:hypothetical protein
MESVSGKENRVRTVVASVAVTVLVIPAANERV